MFGSANKYVLGRDINASIRLDMAHWMWRRELGYLLNPSIPVQNEESFKVADIACGTGIWLLDLAKELPKATLEGFDISTAQFPHQNWLPGNVRLKELDAFADLPEHLIGRYDVVHIGLVVSVVRGGDPQPLLRNLLKLLKPGGYLQWREADINDLTPIAATPDLNFGPVKVFYDRMRDAVAKVGIDMDARWVNNLGAKVAEQDGVKCIVSRRYGVPDDLARPASQNHLASLGEIVGLLPDAVVEELDLWNLYGQAAVSMRAGVSVRVALIVVVGCKSEG